jgi:small conductance mechanosensitive channel
MDWTGILERLADHVLHEPRFAGNATAIGIVLAALLVGWAVLRKLLGALSGEGHTPAWSWLEGPLHWVRSQARSILGWLAFTAAVGTVTIGTAYHLAGRDIQHDLESYYQQLTAEQLQRLGLAAGQLVGIALAARLALALVRRARPRLEARAVALLRMKSAGEALPRLFTAAERLAVAAVALGAAAVAARAIGQPWLAEYPLFALRLVAIVVAARIATLAVRALLVPLADLGDRRFSATSYAEYWSRVTGLFPLGERCLEAAVWVTAATKLSEELQAVAFVAQYGPGLVKCIGIFFGARVLIELLSVLLHGLFGMQREEAERDQRRRTLVPLLHSGCQYAIYVGAAVMMLGVFEIPTAPFLAGLGIVGMALGLGAQSLITDFVSGLFILFEGQYLVGDYVEIAGAKGTVEAIAVRHTLVRDDEGKLHLIPNGQIKQVANHSKGYVNAVVQLTVPAGNNVDAVVRAMAEAGRQLRQTRREVLADTRIDGLADLTLSERTVRAVTKVRPGAKERMEAEYRRLLQQALDGGAPLAKAA